MPLQTWIRSRTRTRIWVLLLLAVTADIFSEVGIDMTTITTGQ